MDNMDHSSHHHGGGHSMMMMYFHGGHDEVILFDFWRISTVGGLVGSMIACFVLAVAYEGLKCFRDHLYGKTMANNASVSPEEGNFEAEMTDYKKKSSSRMKTKVKTLIKTIETSVWSKIHIVSWMDIYDRRTFHVFGQPKKFSKIL